MSATKTDTIPPEVEVPDASPVKTSDFNISKKPDEEPQKPTSQLQKSVQNSFSLQLEDPLVFNDIENKSPVMTRSIKLMQQKNHVFRPSVISFPNVFGGHLQTILTEIKDEYVNLAFPEQFEFKYDKQEVFKFKDGGETFISYKLHDDGNFDKDLNRDLLFLFSGQVGSD